jgi:hypothetical protein
VPSNVPANIAYSAGVYHAGHATSDVVPFDSWTTTLLTRALGANQTFSPSKIAPLNDETG